MDKFICLECGNVFDEDDIVSWSESRGEFWGVACSETVSGSPCCEGDYIEAYRCSCCDEWIEGQYIKLDDGERICDKCYTIYEVGEEDF